MNRRRVLALSAAALALPGSTVSAPPVRWTGIALGAEVSLTLRAPEKRARAAIADALAEIHRVEAAFSLYRKDSELVRLNSHGTLRPSPLFSELLGHIDHAHGLTDGTFDPTVQSVWAALARNRAPDPTLVGWQRVTRTDTQVTLAPGQALTFNGIAQGFATDRVRAVLVAHGLTDVLVNMGEYAGRGGPWRLGIADPAHGLVARTTLTDGAIATTSAAPHLIDPHGRAPQHATVSIEAPTATAADALSTAALFLPASDLVRLKGPVTAIHVVDDRGRYRLI